MSNRQSKILVIVGAIILLAAGSILYYVFEKQGYGKINGNKIYSYNIKDYVQTVPITYNNYGDIYSNINVSKIKIKNISDATTKDFLKKEDEVIGYITKYYDEMKKNSSSNSSHNSTALSTIKTQINGTVLSIFYELDFQLDSNCFEDNIKKYIITTNIDLKTENILTNDILLVKYDYTKEYISEKIFQEDILIPVDEIVIDRNTNISLTSKDIERKKDIYVDRIIDEFDNIIDLYIENNSLAIVYNREEINNMFFEGDFAPDIEIRYLK